MPLLNIRDLNIKFNTTDGIVNAVSDLSFSLEAKTILGIVGESGSGKTQLALSIIGLLANNSTVSGSIKFHDQELLNLKNKQFNQIRGSKIAMIFQDPMTALNPYLTIKTQMIEVLTTHLGVTKSEAVSRSIELLDFVKISDAVNRINLYPHELSGGMRQRVMIAQALLCRPELLIADEPTTALDVTVQAQILEILKDLRVSFNTSILLISHDMAVIANICDQINVMYAGSLVESGKATTILNAPLHPYTRALLDTIPDNHNGNLRLKTIAGDVPNLKHLPLGCPFQSRCDYVTQACQTNPIATRKYTNNHLVKCCNLANDSQQALVE